jgi:hypothetical protein
MARPWDLGFALDGARGQVKPGDTIWLRGGTYRGAYRSSVTGIAGAPVTIRQFPGERATLDAAGATAKDRRGDFFVVTGDYSVFWGFEITDSDPNRSTDTRPNMIVNDASHTRYLGLVVHDGGIGFYTYSNRADVEVNGCVFYNNGWDAPGQSGGHAIYGKSDAGPLVLRDNIAFNQYGYGLHLYTEARSGLLNNIRLEGNVAFNNGTAAARPQASNILVGGRAPADAIQARDNMAYYSPGVGLVNVFFGWRSAALQNGTATLANNYFIGGSVVLDVHAWTRFEASGNTLYSPSARETVRLDAGAKRLDPANRMLKARPGASRVFVRPLTYERAANVVIYNWARRDTVAVDLSGVLRRGERYEVRNVQGMVAPPLLSGEFRGEPVGFPMSGVPPPPPIGTRVGRAPKTAPDFDVFVVTTR